MPFSLIVWENAGELPFPKEVRELVAQINWDEYEWHITGLPHPFAKYSMSGGKKLYLSELPDGSIKIEQDTSFTGKVLLAGFFTNDKDEEGNNYFINFLVTILNGEVIDVQLDKVQSQTVKSFKIAMQDFNDNIRKVMAISNSWWFKWLYRPYFLAVRGVAYVLLFILGFIRGAVVWTTQKLTPL